MAITKLKALGVTANTITASQIANNTITNTQINSSAAIAASKLGTMATANMPAGSVLQVQTTNAKATSSAITSTSFVDIGISCSITPSATSSKILIHRTQGFYIYGGGADIGFNTLLLRSIGGGSYSGLNSGRTAANSSGAYIGISATGASNAELADIQGLTFLDTPNTTSAITYKIQVSMIGAGGSAQMNLSNDTYTNLTLLEIKG